MTRIANILLFAALLAAPRLAAQSAPMPVSPAALEKLKSLVGHWQAEMKDGQKTNIYISVLSKGNCVQEAMDAGTPHAMLTIYCADKGGVMMTHYCAAGNQPRMRAESWAGDTIAFDFVDASGLATPDDGHMHKLEISLKDADHYTATWTYREKGQDQPWTFNLERVKAAPKPAARPAAKKKK